MIALAGILGLGLVAPAAAVAQDTAASPEFVLSSPGRGTGVGHYRESMWGLVAFEVENRSPAAAHVTASLSFAGDPAHPSDSDPSLQFARHLWLPARSRRSAWLTVRTPSRLPADEQRLNFRLLLLPGDASTNELIQTHTGEMFETSAVRVVPQKSVTGLIDESPWQPLEAVHTAALEAVIAARVDQNRKRVVSSFPNEFLPHSLEALDGLDQLVLAGNQLAEDPAAVVAVRRWLIGGGRLWVMLDLVDAETVAMLLEDAWTCQVVDRVGLTTVEIVGTHRATRNVSAASRDFEEPVDFVRVLTSNVRESFRIDGWPAAFSQRVGNGHVLFTTLGARGWIRPRTRYEREPSEPLLRSSFLATEPLRHLAAEFVQPRERATLPAAAWRSVVHDQIGESIVGRGTVFSVLGVFCVTLLAAGLVLSWRQRLEWVRWFAPGAALLAAGALAIAGSRARQQAPATVIMGQVVQTAPGTSDVEVTGLLAIHHPEADDAPISATSGGVLWPDMTALAGSTRRMIWTDLDRWHWQHLHLVGTREAPFQTGARLERPIEARVRFGPDGLEGRLDTGPFTHPADCVIATPARTRLAAQVDADGTLLAGPSDVLAPGEFVAAGLLSDEQRRRQAIYEQLFSREDRELARDRPVLFAWCDPLETNFRFPAAQRVAGSALLCIPLTIEPTPRGTQVRIPAPLIAYQVGPGPGEVAFSSNYDNRARRWHEKAGFSRNWLRFQMPPTLLPLNLERVRLTLHITGPARRIELFGVQDGAPVSLETREDPVGTIHFEITRREVLATDDDGRLLLGVFVGLPAADQPDPDVRNSGEVRDTWRIEFLRLDAEGQTQP